MKAVFWSFFLILMLFISSTLVAQDECANAVDIPVLNYSTCGDMAFEGIDFATATASATGPAPACGGYNATREDLWYTYTVPAGVTQMAFHMFNSSNNPPFPNAAAPAMALYRGNCGALVLIDCFEGAGAFMSNAEIRWEIATGLVPGETIYLRVWDENNLDQEIFIAASVNTSMPEDDCDTPIPLSEGGCNILSTGGDITAPSLCGWNTTDNSVFYNFTVTVTDPQPYTISVENGNCWQNDGTMLPEDAEIQFAVYEWNGIDCTDIGGAGASYMGCANGTGTVVFAENLPPGDYILAMDGYSMLSGNSLCIYGFEAPFIPLLPDVLSVTLSTVDAGCGQQGSATITVNSSCNGNPTIAWSNLTNGATASNLAAGPYSVTVTDDAACGDTIINFTINALANFAVAVTTTGNPCTEPVVATANVMGANPGDCTFSWTGGFSTQAITLTNPGTYTVTATYGTCVDESSYTLIDADFDFSVNYTPTICAGSTGSAQFNAITGSGNYMFEWSGGVGSLIAPGIQIAAPGNYCLTATDMVSGCQLTRCVTITEVPAVSVSITTDHITCHDFNDGKVTAIASGGTEPYSYQWNGFSGSGGTNLISGNYHVTVTDDNGCTGYATTFVENPPIFTYALNQPDGICFGEQAELHVTVFGGVEPYIYSWNEPGINTPDRIVSPPNTTQYTVSVYDANMCTFPAQSVTVIVSQPIVINVDVENILCHGVCEGSAVLDIEGGIPPFQFSWGSTTDYWENLCVGDYSVTLTDLYECTGSANFSITEPDTIYLSMSTGMASCWGYNDGFAEVDVIGGVPFTNEFGSFYQYQWSNAMTQDSIALGYGYYYVTVSDANGCEHVAMAFVDQPEAIFVTNAWNGQICIGETFNTFVAATGGTVEHSSGYDFTWIGSDNTYWYGSSLTVSPIVTTMYQLVVTDDNGCFGPIQNITVNVHPVIDIVGANANLDDICIGETITVEMDIEGGNGGPYTINRQHVGIVNMPYTFAPQESGFYTFTVSDDCGSPTDKDSIYVVVHPLPQAAFFADKTSSCPPGVFQFTETTPDFGQTYLWNFGDGGFSVQKNPAHTYTKTGTYDVAVTVWSEFGCKRTRTYNNMIFIHPVPRAEFTALPELVSILDARVEFTNYSDGATTYFWDFGDGFTSMWTTDPQIHKYDAIGEYEITLVAQNQYECLDTISKKIRVHDEFAFYAPEAFTPNGDGLNDYFHVIGHGIDKSQFYLVVYDRYGAKVFETNVWDAENPYRMAWDGSHDGDESKGDPVITNGMYRWYSSFVDFTGKPHEESGTVTLIR
jgi:gliding motility-associated-like protein